MSCLGPCYSPVPTREWSRVQNSCTYYTKSPPPATVTVPLIGTTIPFSALAYQTALINKGNVLQYKKNSSNLNKQQIYTQIAKGMWTNRNTTWATQSLTYTNPNTQHLKRVGGEWITVNGEISTSYADCPIIPPKTNNILPPIRYTPNNNNPVIPPPPTIKNPTNIIPVVSIDAPKNNIAILDFGNLLCNTTENICTGETIIKPANSNWHPTTDSDVPGTIQELYWNERIQTWYPKERLTMNNSTDKWPQGAKFIGTANTTCSEPEPVPPTPILKHPPPIITSVIPTTNTAYITWKNRKSVDINTVSGYIITLTEYSAPEDIVVTPTTNTAYISWYTGNLNEISGYIITLTE